MSAPSARRERRLGRAEVLALAAATLLVAVAVALPGAPAADEAPGGIRSTRLLPLDDAYIFIRFAQQLARGRPLQWADGELSTGATSLLFPALLVPGQWLSDDLGGWSRWSLWVGACSLFLCGLAAARVLGAAGFGRPWPLVGGLLVLLSGPLGNGSLSGMESGLNAAGVLFAAALVTELARGEGAGAAGRGPTLAAVACVAVLPWLRPENVVLTLLAVAAVLLRRLPPLRPVAVPFLLAPGALMIGLYLAAAGQPLGAGAVTKSVLATPYADLGVVARLYALNWKVGLGPLYGGLRPHLLAPGVGLLAAVGVLLAARARWARLRPLAVAWLALVLLAPFSTILMWQHARHHQAGIACALVLATAVLAAGTERLAPRLRWLALLLPLAPAADLPHWRETYSRGALEIAHRHGPAVAWLRQNARDEVLVLNDAGLPALAHDGPMVDVMGLGTPDMGAAHRHGAGAVAEELARRRPLPTVAAANLDVFRLPQILGAELVPGLAPASQTVIRSVRTDVLRGTVLGAPGVDFAYLPSEEAANPGWDPPPLPLGASLAGLFADATGPTIQGCRPLRGALTLELPRTAALSLRAVSLEATPAAVSASFPADEGVRTVSLEFPPGRWTSRSLGGAAAGTLRLQAVPGGQACLEAIVWGPAWGQVTFRPGTSTD